MQETSHRQRSSEGGIPPVSVASDLETLDTEAPPERYWSPGTSSSQGTPNDDPDTSHSTTPTLSPDRRRTSAMQSPSEHPSRTPDQHQQQSTNQQSTPRKLSQSLFRRFIGTPQPDPIETNAQQLPNTQADEMKQLTKLLREQTAALNSMSENHIKEKEHQQQLFRDEWQHREHEIQQHYQHIEAQKNDLIQSLQVQVQELASHRNQLQGKYNTLLREQQEVLFKHMETGRWLPKDETRVLEDFDRIRTQMRTWARIAAVKNMAAIQEVKGEQLESFMVSLSRVAVVENNQLSRGLSTPKGPSLLLNALLAHDVYTSLFQGPFFFLKDDPRHEPTREGLDYALDKIYSLALAANVEDAHIWRSQTLRLLFPPQRAGNTDGEKDLHQWTERVIVKVAEPHASRFAASSVQHLIDTNTANIKRLNSIYREAASVSYMLWT